MPRSAAVPQTWCHMHDYFVMFAAYNRWANERLYEAAAKLPEADYRADRGAFFGSLNGTLNHLLVGDRTAGGSSSQFDLFDVLRTHRCSGRPRGLRGA